MLRKLGFLLGCLLLPLSLFSQNYTVRAFGGYNSINLKAHPEMTAKIDGGQLLGVAFGYRFNELFHAELETAYRINSVTEITIKGNQKYFHTTLRRKMESFSIVGNGIFTLPPNFWPFQDFVQLYVGGGIGVTAEYADWMMALIEHNVWYQFEEGKRLGTSYQLLAGFHLPEYRGIVCGVEFKFLDSVLDHMCCRNKSMSFTCGKKF